LTTGTMSYEAFFDIIRLESSDLIALCASFVENVKDGDVASRPFLGRFYREATKLEELLDICGAQKNSRWFPFRKLIASGKLFSRVTYNLLHIKYFIPTYKLLSVDEDFLGRNEEALRDLTRVLSRIVNGLIDVCRQNGILDSQQEMKPLPLSECTCPGKLPADRTFRHVEMPGKTVVQLATAFLNLSAESQVLSVYQKVSDGDYGSCIPDMVNEDVLRGLESKFHGMQSQYDTYISDSDIELADTNLPVMRGHISIIYHLLEIATDFCHYYERHIASFANKVPGGPVPLVPCEEVLRLLFPFCIAFANRFLKSAKALCQNMIKQYAEEGEIDVSIPIYRGFHVRPSTLIARIIHHYGSEVKMYLNGKDYDASRPLELFRANEEINALKRRQLLSYIEKVKIIKDEIELTDVKIALHEVFMELLKHKKIILYDRNFSFDELKPMEGETIAEYVKRGIAHSLALGWIDILTDIHATFAGDKRVLADIKILADHGYGEDKYGNNIVLPAELSYLKY
jgi:hypothetical protein